MPRITENQTTDRNATKRYREDEERSQRSNRPRYLESKNNIPKALVKKETDEKRLAARQKQVDFGKNTVGYQRYNELVPKAKRTKQDPWTPDKYSTCSKRSWDGQIRKWRRLLHEYDPPTTEGEIEIGSNDEEELVQLQKELDGTNDDTANGEADDVGSDIDSNDIKEEKESHDEYQAKLQELHDHLEFSEPLENEPTNAFQQKSIPTKKER